MGQLSVLCCNELAESALEPTCSGSLLSPVGGVCHTKSPPHEWPWVQSDLGVECKHPGSMGLPGGLVGLTGGFKCACTHHPNGSEGTMSNVIALAACRNPPGRLSPTLAQDLGLNHNEITLVMTDVQASSKIWEW